jgi:EAL domain-containing protein (putative c-di-GMP-specific phosphodiesterase class I)
LQDPTPFVLEVVANGDQALASLKAHHCQQVQGFLFSQPLPGYQFEKWSRQHATH